MYTNSYDVLGFIGNVISGVLQTSRCLYYNSQYNRIWTGGDCKTNYNWVIDYDSSRGYGLIRYSGDTTKCLDEGGGVFTGQANKLYGTCDITNGWQQWQFHNPQLVNLGTQQCFSEGSYYDSVVAVCASNNIQYYSFGCGAGQTPTYAVDSSGAKAATGCALCIAGTLHRTVKHSKLYIFLWWIYDLYLSCQYMNEWMDGWMGALIVWDV